MTRYDPIEPNMTQSDLKKIKAPVPVAVVVPLRRPFRPSARLRIGTNPSSAAVPGNSRLILFDLHSKSCYHNKVTVLANRLPWQQNCSFVRGF